MVSVCTTNYLRANGWKEFSGTWNIHDLIGAVEHFSTLNLRSVFDLAVAAANSIVLELGDNRHQIWAQAFNMFVAGNMPRSVDQFFDLLGIPIARPSLSGHPYQFVKHYSYWSKPWLDDHTPLLRASIHHLQELGVTRFLASLGPARAMLFVGESQAYFHESLVLTPGYVPIGTVYASWPDSGIQVKIICTGDPDEPSYVTFDFSLPEYGVLASSFAGIWIDIESNGSRYISEPTSDHRLSSFVGLKELTDKLVASASHRPKTHCLLAGTSNAGKSKYARAFVLEQLISKGYTVIVLDPAIAAEFDWPFIGIQKLAVIIDDGGCLLASRSGDKAERKVVNHWLKVTEGPFFQSSASRLGLERSILFITTNDPEEIDSAFLINEQRFDFVVGVTEPQYIKANDEKDSDRRVFVASNGSLSEQLWKEFVSTVSAARSEQIHA